MLFVPVRRSSSATPPGTAAARGPRGHGALVPPPPATDHGQRGSAFPIPPGASGWKRLVGDKPIIVQEASQRQPGRTSRTLETDFSGQPELLPPTPLINGSPPQQLIGSSLKSK